MPPLSLPLRPPTKELLILFRNPLPPARAKDIGGKHNKAPIPETDD